MAELGFFKQMKHHLTTSQYGTLTRGPVLINDEMKAQARHNFVHDIQGGAIMEEWTKNSEAATERLHKLQQAGLSHPMSINEDRVIEMIQAAQRKS